MTTNIPEILLLCMDDEFISAFNTSLQTNWPTHNPQALKITPINERLNSLPEGTTFDLIVSPANSYGRLDGAFDAAISRAFSPRNDYHAVTRAAQAILYEKWRGFAPPGTCTLVPFPEELKGNPFGCAWVALCPTMREPGSVEWDREVVYECVWSLLGQIEGWNRGLGKDGDGDGRKIKRILMTPLAAGIGNVSKKRWAAQTVLALKHFVDALERPERWGSLSWRDIEEDCVEVEKTWKESGKVEKTWK
jgi:O-acetyl-ADP-ribose deacetylase (regulator of RNase III)